MAYAKSARKELCRDCRKEISIGDGGKISDGFELIYNNDGDKIKTFKCKSCFGKDKSLRNYQDCEVYSRVVGYLRPVQQWNDGKREEFNKRKDYKI